MGSDKNSARPITTSGYWDSVWSQGLAADSINPFLNNPENHFYRKLHAIFLEALGAPSQTRGQSLIELGCGGSRWLPYFAAHFGYVVCGLDYSETGVELARANLELSGIGGDIRRGDLFEPPTAWLEQFDVVVSFGLVEHFRNTSEVVVACARYLRPGGLMFTLVPTMRGLDGLAYRVFNPSVYQKHVPQTRDTLTHAHHRAGLVVTNDGYILGLPVVLTKPEQQSLLSKLLSP